MTASPAFQFYAAEYLADENVTVMTLEEEGAYIRALAYCWREGSIPADPERLSRLLKGASNQTLTVVIERFEPNSNDPSRLVHHRLERERQKQADWRAKSSAAGVASGKSRKQPAKVVKPKKKVGSDLVQPKPNSSSSFSSSSSDCGQGEERASAPPPIPIHVTDGIATDWEAEEESNIPDDLPAPSLGNFMLQRLGITHSHSLALQFADAAALLARELNCPRGKAAAIVLQRARDNPPADGKWRFWLEDGGWKQQGVSTEGWES